MTQPLGKRKVLGSHAGRERFSSYILHHEIYGAVIFGNFEDLADKWVIQGCRSQRFAAKALPGYDVSGQMGRQKLDGDATIQMRIVCEVDYAHSAGAETLQNLVRTELCTRSQSYMLNRPAPTLEVRSANCALY
jgi:hypothetical protein